MERVHNDMAPLSFLDTQWGRHLFAAVVLAGLFLIDFFIGWDWAYQFAWMMDHKVLFELIKSFGQIIGGGAAIIAAIRTWRKMHRWQKKHIGDDPVMSALQLQNETLVAENEVLVQKLKAIEENAVLKEKG